MPTGNFFEAELTDLSKNNGRTGRLDMLVLLFCRLWLAGLCPRAPGTCGSAVAVLLVPWCFLPLPLLARLLLLACLLVLGTLAAGRAERIIGKDDPGEVVIDELVGQWLVFLPFAGMSIIGLLLGFVLFRLFDIIKPWPIRWSEKRFPGGFGVMLDDLLAGVYAMLILLLINHWWKLFGFI